MNMIRQLFGPAPSTLDAVSPTPQPAPQAAPQAAAGSDSLAQMLRIMSGDLSSLGTGDKLMALSGLLRSATRSGRRAGLTPQQVLGQVQQQQLQRIQGRVQVEQLRAAEAQRQQQAQAMSRFVATLPPDKQALFPGLDAEGKQDMLQEHLSPQPFQIVKSGGESFMVFRDNTRVKLDIPRDVEPTYVDTGDGVTVIDNNTGQIIGELPKEMSKYQAASLDIRQKQFDLLEDRFEFYREQANLPEPLGTPTIKRINLNGEPVMMQVQLDPNTQEYLDLNGNPVE